MKRTLPSLIFLILVMLLSNSLVFSESKIPFTRDQSVINAFQIMCQLSTLKFDSLSARAMAMRMVLQDNQKTPSSHGTMIQSKSWIGNLTTGPFIYMLEEMSGPKGVSTSCAVVADVSNQDADRLEAIKELNLKKMPSLDIGGDGSRTYIWDRSPEKLIIREYQSVGRSGVMIKILTMRPSNNQK